MAEIKNSDTEINNEADIKNDKAEIKTDKAEIKNVEAEVKNDKAAEDIDDVISPLELKVINQIEYYFGDANMIRDKFLIEQVNKNEDGWVPISILLTFKRLASLSEDPEVIVKSLLKSDEGLIEVSEDHKKIRRHPERPIPEHNEERRNEITSRTAYVKGFPLESDIAEIIDYFQAHQKVANVSMRKYLEKHSKTYKFKGSVFATFVTKEQCEDFIGKEKLEYKGRALIRKWQGKYLEEKREERQNKKNKNDKKKNKPELENKIDLPKGAVIYFEGTNPDTTTREHLRSAFEKLGGDVAYIDFSKGDKVGYVRFNVEKSAGTIIEKCPENKLKLNDGELELTLRVIEGDEEKEFLTKVVESMKSRRQHNKGFKGFKGRHDRGSGHNRKRRGSDSTEPAAKQNKKEETSEIAV